MKKFFIAVGLLFCSASSHAGQGWYIHMINNTDQSNEKINMFDEKGGKYIKYYPAFTVHTYGGSNCWYDEGLSDWNQISWNGDQDILMYTEEENSDSCFFAGGFREFAVYARYSFTSPWVRVSVPYKIWNKYVEDADAVPNKFTVGAGKRDHPGYCGLRFIMWQPTWQKGDTQYHLYVETAGAMVENCETPANAKSLSTVTDKNSLLLSESKSVAERVINLHMGQTRIMKLKGLDSQSVWELDQCEGDAVTTNGVIPKHTARKVLPSEVKVTAIKAGQEICDITSWHYPERSEVIKGRIIFNVK